MRLIYAGLTTLAAPLLRRMLVRRAGRGKEVLARLPEREGVDATARPAGRLLWLHAASVGETVSILPLLPLLSEAATVLVTTGTVTSAALLAQRLPAGGRVLHRFVPLDVPEWVSRFLEHWRPEAGGIVESEVWPNMLAACERRGIPVMMVNARMSARSFSRWRWVPGAKRVFGGFAAVQARSEEDGARLRALGTPASGLVGNLKLAAAPLPVDEVELARLRGIVGGRPVWLAASIHPGEDAGMLAVHARLLQSFPDVLTILAPRHPERGAAMASGAPRRSLGQDPAGPIWVADTLGELGLLYRLAGAAFVGKSLGAAGGQNPLEPARLGCAVAVGPEVENFAEAVAALEAAGALARVADIDALAAWVAAMWRDPARRAAMGSAGVAATQGAEAMPAQVAEMLLGLAR